MRKKNSTRIWLESYCPRCKTRYRYKIYEKEFGNLTTLNEKRATKFLQILGPKIFFDSFEEAAKELEELKRRRKKRKKEV